MFKLIQQKGSSSVGLLTATAIFIGLLVYANQFAFNNSENSFLSSFIDKTFNTNKTSGTVATPSVEVISSVDTDTIQPSTQGIFETPTLTLEDHKVDVNSTKPDARAKLSPDMVTGGELAAKQAVSQPDIMPVNYAPGHWYGNPGYGDQAALAAYNYHKARFNTDQQYYSTSGANGRGNGRGKMNGDGEFNFSMKFKARGRMDADSDFDSNLVADGNAYQQNLYNVNAFYNPAYRYNYYSY